MINKTINQHNLQIGIKVSNIKNLKKNRGKTIKHNKPGMYEIFIAVINNNAQKNVYVDNTKRRKIQHWQNIALRITSNPYGEKIYLFTPAEKSK